MASRSRNLRAGRRARGQKSVAAASPAAATPRLHAEMVARAPVRREAGPPACLPFGGVRATQRGHTSDTTILGEARRDGQTTAGPAVAACIVRGITVDMKTSVGEDVNISRPPGGLLYVTTLRSVTNLVAAYTSDCCAQRDR